MTDEQPGRPAVRRRSRRGIGSTAVFLGLAVVLIAIAVVYTRRDNGPAPTAPPPNNPGHNELVNVVNALKGAGLSVDYGTGSGKATGLSQPWQQLTVEGQPLFVFIYPTAADRQADAANADAGSLRVTKPSGTPAARGPFRLFQGSNVLVALNGGSDDLAANVQQVIQGLP